MNIHLPECSHTLVTCSDGSVRPRSSGPCICDELASAYRRGYNDHARSAAHGYQMYGIGANQHGAGENP